jgi:hypothetical protein
MDIQNEFTVFTENEAISRVPQVVDTPRESFLLRISDHPLLVRRACEYLRDGRGLSDIEQLLTSSKIVFLDSLLALLTV